MSIRMKGLSTCASKISTDLIDINGIIRFSFQIGSMDLSVYVNSVLFTLIDLKRMKTRPKSRLRLNTLKDQCTVMAFTKDRSASPMRMVARKYLMYNRDLCSNIGGGFEA